MVGYSYGIREVESATLKGNIMSEKDKKPPIWESFCAALDTEYREANEIIGASGLPHPVQAVGVDDKGKRVVLVSSEYNPRISALMRIDVQATMPDVRVIVARPLAVDLAHAARKLFFTDDGALDIGKLMQLATIAQSGEKAEEALKEQFGAPAVAVLNSIERSSLPLRSHMLNLVDQIGRLDWKRVSVPKDGEFLQTGVDLLTQFSSMDNLAGDRQYGICPVPTYELTESDWELFGSRKHIDGVRERLRELNIFQYFYPPADSLTLGLIDSGIANEEMISDGMNLAQQQGHTISKNAIISEAGQLSEIIEKLKEEGYAMEGEFSMELTNDGKAVRQTLKVRPSEGLITKLSQLLSIKVDINLRDIFK